MKLGKPIIFAYKRLDGSARNWDLIYVLMRTHQHVSGLGFVSMRALIGNPPIRGSVHNLILEYGVSPHNISFLFFDVLSQ